jgi:hypothetical protein
VLNEAKRGFGMKSNSSSAVATVLTIGEVPKIVLQISKQSCRKVKALADCEAKLQKSEGFCRFFNKID